MIFLSIKVNWYLMVIALVWQGKNPRHWGKHLYQRPKWEWWLSCLYRVSVLYKIWLLGISVPLAVNYREVRGTVIPCPKGILRQIQRPWMWTQESSTCFWSHTKEMIMGRAARGWTKGSWAPYPVSSESSSRSSGEECKERHKRWRCWLVLSPTPPSQLFPSVSQALLSAAAPSSVELEWFNPMWSPLSDIVHIYV